MRNFSTEGIVIRRKNFGEADRYLTIFTKKQGKIKVLAKGVRRIHSRRGPNIELFNKASFFIHQGRVFNILSEVVLQDSFSSIRKSLELIGLAYYICELIDGLCAEEQPHPNAYNLLLNTMNELDKGAIQRFEVGLLSELGFLSQTRAFPAMNTTSYIEQILERRLKSKKFLAKLSS